MPPSLSGDRSHDRTAVSGASFGLNHNHLLIKSQPWPAVPFGSMRTWDMDLVQWFELNPSRGKYKWGSLDRLMKMADQRGVEVIYTFGRAPTWAISGRCLGPYAPAGCANPAANLEDWDAFVRAIASHAGGRIKYWEIWNEPNLKDFWSGDIATLIAMERRARRIILAIDPNAKIIAPSPTKGNCSKSGYGEPACWMRDYMAAGGGQYSDIIAFHGYLGNNPKPEDLVDMAGQMKSVMADYGHGAKQLWDTEGSQCDVAVPDVVAFLARFQILHVSAGVSRMFWYAWDSPECGGLWQPGKGVNRAGSAYAMIYKWLVGATMQSRCIMARDLTFTCRLVREGGYQAELIWNPRSKKSVSVAPRYIHYRDLEGNVGPVENGRVVVGPRPLLIESNARTLN